MKDRKRLERIIHVKERIRDLRRGELASAEHAVTQAEQEATEAAAVEQSAIGSLMETGIASAADLARKAVIVALASRSVNHARSELEERVAERDERAETAFTAVREVRALETLNRRLATREQARERSKEQGETDEAAARASVGR